MDNKKKVILSGLAMTLVAGATSGAALAYLTDGETAENTFTIGDVSIEGIEPNYPGNDCDEVKDIVPNDEIDKDPQIDNDGINDAIVFMTVDSPMELVTIVNDNGSHLQEKGVNELFWFKNADDALSTHANNFNQDWQELAAKEMYIKISADGTETQLNDTTPEALLAAYNAKAADEHIVKRYVFGYTEVIQGSSTHDGTPQTAENKVTSALFDKIQLKNVIENEIDESVEKIVVRSYAIQATKILENSVDLAANLNEANLGKIYDIFIRQNSAQNDSSGLRVAGLRGADTLTPTTNGASGTTDTHKNRFGTQDDVESENCNLNPEACRNSEETHFTSIYGEWTTTKDEHTVRYIFNEDDDTFEYYVDNIKRFEGDITNVQDGTITLEVTETFSDTPVGTVITLNYETNENFTEITSDEDDVWERIIPEEMEPYDITGVWTESEPLSYDDPYGESLHWIEFVGDVTGSSPFFRSNNVLRSIESSYDESLYATTGFYDTQQTGKTVKVSLCDSMGEHYGEYILDLKDEGNNSDDVLVMSDPRDNTLIELHRVMKGSERRDACYGVGNYFYGKTDYETPIGLVKICDDYAYWTVVEGLDDTDIPYRVGYVNPNPGYEWYRETGGSEIYSYRPTDVTWINAYNHRTVAIEVIFDNEYRNQNVSRMIFLLSDEDLLYYLYGVKLYTDFAHENPISMDTYAGSLSYYLEPSVAEYDGGTVEKYTVYGHYSEPQPEDPEPVGYDSVDGEWYGAGMKFVVDSSANQKITAYEKVDGTWQTSSRRIVNITLGTNQIKMRLASSSSATLLTFDVNETFDTAESTATGLILTREEPTVDERFIGNWTYSSYRYTFDEDSNYSVTYGGTTNETGTYFTTDSKLVLINSTGKVTSYDYTYVSGTTTRLNLTSGLAGMTLRKSS